MQFILFNVLCDFSINIVNDFIQINNVNRENWQILMYRNLWLIWNFRGIVRLKKLRTFQILLKIIKEKNI